MTGQTAGQQDNLQYEIKVRAQIVPIFAVDAAGNPVYDLKEEEIDFQVNGKRVPFIYFTRYTLDDEQKETIKPESVKQSGVKPQSPRSRRSPERINFIIVDAILGNLDSLNQSLDVVKGIIEKSSPGDGFVIIESNQVSGFSHIVGPTKDKKELRAGFKKVVKRFRRRRLVVPPAPDPAAYVDPYEWMMDTMVHGTDKEDIKRDQEKYQRDIRMFTHALKQLKYALKTTSLPKTVFLLSAGLKTEGIGGTTAYYRFLEEAAKAINYGGSMFYLINPLQARSRQAATSLKFMADKVGGKFIYGENTKELVAQVKKSTSAYYELVFYPDKHGKNANRISLKSKRKGIELSTINYSETPKPYAEMPAIQKKLFALNVVNGGAWSRMVGKVAKTKYKKIKNKGKGKTIEVPIPPPMRDRALDVFVVAVDAQTQRAGISIASRKMGAREKISVPEMKGKAQFVVMVDPTQTRCIYTPVK
ncbi:MAG: hypothetical protein GY950_14495 [bacterium]|nr:hypothetical protein [bacterium]